MNSLFTRFTKPSVQLGVRFLSMKEKAIKAVKPRALLTVDNAPYQVRKIQQGKRGKGGGFVKATMKNLITGITTEKTYTSDETVEVASIDRTKVQYTYSDGDDIVFMNTETFDEIRVNKSVIEHESKYLVEGSDVVLMEFQGTPFGIDLPTIMEFTIESVDPTSGRATSGEHPATLEGGAIVMVPNFIDAGVRVKVNVDEDKYVERC
jgi:elongation factor P